MSSFKAVIFDRDGVLVDTESIYANAYNETLRHFGSPYVYTHDRRNSEAGIPTLEVMARLKEELGLLNSIEELAAYYRTIYRNTFENEGVQLFDGVVAFIKSLQNNDIKIAIGTGSSHQNNEIVLQSTGLGEYFSVIVSADDVAKGKPDPETFVTAANLLGVEPLECIVIGDSDNDRLGAKNGGMKFVMIASNKSGNDYPDNPPDLIVHSIKDLSFEILNNL